MIIDRLQHKAYFKFLKFDDALYVSLNQAKEVLIYELDRSIRIKNYKLSFNERLERFLQ